MISTVTLFSLAQQTIEKAKPPSSLLPLGAGGGERLQRQTIMEIIGIFSEVYYIFVRPPLYNG